jgi:tRNA-specific 2-thiouridylase
LGDYSKTEVRNMARQRGLPPAEQPDSQDLCFVADGDYRRFLAGQIPSLVRPGPIFDSSGRRLGQHRGLTHYTIGQRKGLGIAAPEPLYVLALKPTENALVVGPEWELGRDVCLAQGVSWVAGEPPAERFEASAKIRYKARDVPVWVDVLAPDRVRATFAEPLRDITPGQSLVLYQGPVVLGGGAIDWEEGA